MPSAVKLVTKGYTATGTPTGLHTILGYKRGVWIRSVTIRAARTNSGDVYWSDASYETGGFIGAGEAVTIDFGEGLGFADDVYLNGSGSVYLSVEVARYFFEVGSVYL